MPSRPEMTSAETSQPGSLVVSVKRELLYGAPARPEMEAAPNVCALCHEETEFLYSFGWLDAEGEWRDKVTCCERCAPAQAVKQDTSLRIAALQNKWAHFGQPRIYPTSQRYA